MDAFITADLTEIRVDGFIQRSRANRYRFSLAHELGRLLIHRDVFSALKFTTIEEFRNVSRGARAAHAFLQPHATSSAYSERGYTMGQFYTSEVSSGI